MSDIDIKLTYALVAASFVRQVHDRIEAGHGPPDAEMSKMMMEEAFTVADLGRDALRALRREDEAKEAAKEAEAKSLGDSNIPAC